MAKVNMAFMVVPFLVSQAAYAQSMIESTAVQGAAAGLGAGLAASRDHGKVVRNTYESAVLAQQAVAAQTKAVQQYMKIGMQYETKKDWDNAEKSFKYALHVVAQRDGPGSIKSVPVLQHLVTVTQAQGNLQDAINFQKTVVGFTKAAKIPDQHAVYNEQVNLGNLFIQKEDYTNAEPVFREVLAAPAPALPQTQRIVTLDSYGKVLRKLRKNSEAEQVEAELEKQLQAQHPVQAELPKDNSPAPVKSEQKPPEASINLTPPTGEQAPTPNIGQTAERH